MRYQSKSMRTIKYLFCFIIVISQLLPCPNSTVPHRFSLDVKRELVSRTNAKTSNCNQASILDILIFNTFILKRESDHTKNTKEFNFLQSRVYTEPKVLKI